MYVSYPYEFWSPRRFLCCIYIWLLVNGYQIHKTKQGGFQPGTGCEVGDEITKALVGRKTRNQRDPKAWEEEVLWMMAGVGFGLVLEYGNGFGTVFC